MGRKKTGSFSLIERVILSAGAMLIFSVSFQIDQMPEGSRGRIKAKYKGSREVWCLPLIGQLSEVTHCAEHLTRTPGAPHRCRPDEGKRGNPGDARAIPMIACILHVSQCQHEDATPPECGVVCRPDEEERRSRVEKVRRKRLPQRQTLWAVLIPRGIHD